jgi:hypothetical protein
LTDADSAAVNGTLSIETANVPGKSLPGDIEFIVDKRNRAEWPKHENRTSFGFRCTSESLEPILGRGCKLKPRLLDSNSCNTYLAFRLGLSHHFDEHRTSVLRSDNLVEEVDANALDLIIGLQSE